MRNYILSRADRLPRGAVLLGLALASWAAAALLVVGISWAVHLAIGLI